jgi:hypothetical protein
MTPSNRLKLLGISIHLALCSTIAIAGEEPASDADLARFASSQERLQAQIEEHLQVRVEALFEAELDQILTARTTALLRQENHILTGREEAPPAALQGALASRPTSNTACTMVGRTLECVLRETVEP